MDFEIKEELFVYRLMSDWHKRSDLTQGKIYTGKWNGDMVYSSDGTYYKLENDLGCIVEVSGYHLVPVDKVREEKLEELGI